MIRVKPGQSVDIQVLLGTSDLDRGRCQLRHLTTPDAPNLAPSDVALPLLNTQTISIGDGEHEMRASCPSVAGTLSRRISVRVADGAPERCANFPFVVRPSTADTYATLNAGMVGVWHGCVTTPWVPEYWVDMVLRSDGTYSATASESLDGNQVPALYYGSDKDDPDKRWHLTDLHDDGTGSGTIDIVFGDGSGSVNRDDLRSIQLMGDELQFEMFHAAIYGPLLFQLIRS